MKLKRYRVSKAAPPLIISFLLHIFIVNLHIPTQKSFWTQLSRLQFITVSIYNKHTLLITFFFSPVIYCMKNVTKESERRLHIRSTGKEKPCYNNDIYHADCLHFSLKDQGFGSNSMRYGGLIKLKSQRVTKNGNSLNLHNNGNKSFCTLQSVNIIINQ